MKTVYSHYAELLLFELSGIMVKVIDPTKVRKQETTFRLTDNYIKHLECTSSGDIIILNKNSLAVKKV